MCPLANYPLLPIPAPPAPLRISPADRSWLQSLVTSRGAPARHRLRARIVLALTSGQPDRAIARQLDVSRQTVALWRSRAVSRGVRSVTEDAPGRGRKPVIPVDKRQAVRRAWIDSYRRGRRMSVRDLASTFGLSSSTAHRILEPLFAAVRE